MTGTYVTSITTFDAQGELDEHALRGHFRRMAAARVGVYVAGPAAEGWSLRPDEVRRSLEIAVEELRGRVPVRWMGVEPRHTDEMLERVELAGATGVDALQIYCPDLGHGQKPTASELERYFLTVLASTRTPCVISSHEWEGYLVPAPLLRELADSFSHVIGFNITCANIFYLSEVVDRVGDRAEIHVGGPFNLVTALVVGATGYLSTIPNFAPRLCQDIIDHWRAGDVQAAGLAWRRLLRLKRVLYGTGANPPPVVKAAMDHLGLPGTGIRPPQLPASDAERAIIAGALDEAGVRATETTAR
jgi:4-hydroxy-tetrahydrodipicolinate synthase